MGGLAVKNLAGLLALPFQIIAWIAIFLAWLIDREDGQSLKEYTNENLIL